MKAEIGKYYFGRLRSSWGIWLYIESTLCPGQIGSAFIKGAPTFEDAVKETYHLNGWGEPKSIRKSY